MNPGRSRKVAGVIELTTPRIVHVGLRILALWFPCIPKG